MRMIYSATGKDASTGEIIRKFILEITNENGVRSYIGATEYPMRDSEDDIIPRYMQSKEVNEVLGFLNVTSQSLSESEQYATEFDGFQRGEVSGNMCGRCNLKTEIISEDETVHKYSMRLEILNVRLNQILEQIKSSSGEERLQALEEMKNIKIQINDLEQLIFERELEIENKKREAILAKENEIRARLEKEIWERMAEIERKRTGEWAVKGVSSTEELSDLEKIWFVELEKRDVEKVNFDENAEKIRQLELNLNKIRENTLDLAEDIENGKNTINQLNIQFADENANHKNNLKQTCISLNFKGKNVPFKFFCLLYDIS